MDKQQQQPSKDYAPNGVGRYVVMHLKRPIDSEDGKELLCSLHRFVPVFYSQETGLIQFYWPGPNQIASCTSGAVNEICNRAINAFMERCDRIEFHDEMLEAASGVMVMAGPKIILAITAHLTEPFRETIDGPAGPEMPPFEFGLN